jgi:hypothetical protein
MPTIIAFHEADEVDHWLHSPKRQEIFGPMGITGQLFTDPAKSNRVGLILNVPDMEAFQKVMQSEEAADAMRFSMVSVRRRSSYSSRHPSISDGIGAGHA